MSAEEPDSVSAALLLVVSRESLPEVHSFLGVVSSLGHINETNVIRFGFLFAAVGKRAPELSTQSKSRSGEALHAGIRSGESAHDRAAGLEDHLFTHPLSTVMSGGVSDLMAEHRCQAGFIFGNRQNAFVNSDFSSWQTKRIRFRTIKDYEFPLRIRQVLGSHGSQPLANPLDHGIGSSIVADWCFLFHLIKARQPQLRLLTGGNKAELFPSCYRDGRTSHQNGRQYQYSSPTQEQTSQTFHNLTETHESWTSKWVKYEVLPVVVDTGRANRLKVPAISQLDALGLLSVRIS